MLHSLPHRDIDDVLRLSEPDSDPEDCLRSEVNLDQGVKHPVHSDKLRPPVRPGVRAVQVLPDEGSLRLLPLSLRYGITSIEKLDVRKPSNDVLPPGDQVHLPVEGAVHHPELGEAGDVPDPVHLSPISHRGVGEVQLGEA